MKQLQIIFWGIILPVLIAFSNAHLATNENFAWGHQHDRAISLVLLGIAIFSSCLLFWKSKQWLWRSLSVILVIILFLFFYITASFNFSI
ncbi:MAG TPA: hypothetical protein VG941_02985 [Candidatus Paceibacterota bacterium]|nr:hypothetical protein [Candidatus Paceibacterota bacterium]